MIDFKLDPEDFNFLGTEYNIIEITMDNYENYIPLIEKTINYFNDEIEWKEMFDLQESTNRFKKGKKLYIGLLSDNDPFGHSWFFIDENGNVQCKNVFVRNKIENKTYSGQEFISDIIDKFYSSRSIFCEIDEWNIKSIKLFERLGFKRL